ncbi:MAG: PLP-dependent aminotransferase family protein [Gammaproteobacteria bacterium]|nr:PLP-dependent aminotransferase family protein [Gammaproteobacteria bacterium]
MSAPAMIVGALSLDRDGSLPLHRQLFDALRQAILSGRLRPGARLPSTRVLASDLGVARNTVMAAFEQLVAEGYLQARVGSGTKVSAIAPDMLVNAGASPSQSTALPPTELSLSARGRMLAGAVRALPDAERIAFQPALPAVDEFPFAAWSRLLARHSRKPAHDLLGYAHAGGYAPLRHAIAGYLGAARGVNCTPEQVIVVNGGQSGLDLVARMLLDSGDTAWLEEPGYPGARSALLGAGARLQPVAVDDDGLDVAAGESQAPNARLAYVTPSHQYPLGVSMSLERRLRLIEWAHRANAWVVEDDYDSEYRYRGRPLSALQGLDSGERVIYVGSFAKTLFPALHLGYLVVPRGLVNVFRRALGHTGQGAPLAIQAAVADFMSEGHYASHLRRMRTLYAERQREFCTLLRARFAGVLEPGNADAGLQVTAFLPQGVDDRELARRGGDAGIGLSPLSDHYLRTCPRPGLVLGFAGVGGADMQTGLDRLAALLPDEGARRAVI